MRMSFKKIVSEYKPATQRVKEHDKQFLVPIFFIVDIPELIILQVVT